MPLFCVNFDRMLIAVGDNTEYYESGICIRKKERRKRVQEKE